MRAAVIALVMAVTAVPARASCRLPRQTVRDWGLHQAWEIVEDCAHPEHPARLQAIAWPAQAAPAPALRRRTNGADFQPIEVRPGMPVRVSRQTANAVVELEGTALEPGRRGERIAVRAGLGATVVKGRVAGPGLVQLTNEKRTR